MSGFYYSHRVTYAECTLGNHIYYGRYLELLEAARGEFFRHLGSSLLTWQDQDTVFPVIECRLRYKSPAHYDDLLRIEVWPTQAEGARLSFAYHILNQTGALVLEAETSHACTHVAGKPRRLPPELVAALQAHLTSRH
ncbi:MAG TPA: thioesterase family protein [Candidatus Binatia bacterium]|jgi:acyl-CoA thioester hydrolase|nr:thioesterase family protein [Candidatus Binatia bacterium]